MSVSSVTADQPIPSPQLNQLKPLRAWIPAMLLPLMLLARFIPGLVEDGPAMIWAVAAFGPFLISAAIVLWWLFASRASWREKLIGLIGLVVIAVLNQIIGDPTMRGPLFIVMTIPLLVVGFTLALIVLRNHLTIKRTWIALLVAALCSSVSTLVKSDGVWGNFSFGMAWRWTPTAEDKLLARRQAPSTDTKSTSINPADLANPAWANFRGPNYNSTQSGADYADDWKARPPKELWRISVGPAWSSFVVAGKYLFTQEQRGPNEAVVCYDADTGKQIWEQSIPARFYEGLGGLGPRGTPTLSGGFLYTLGGEGMLLKLNAADGAIVWKCNVHQASKRAAMPMWGYSSSPAVHDGAVIVHAGGAGDKGILAFDTEKGELKWSAPAGEMSYASVQPITILGTNYLALLSETGLHLLQPATGKPVLNYEWKHEGYRALQPQMIGDDKMVIATGIGTGTRLVQFMATDGSAKADAKEGVPPSAESAGKLTTKDLWTSREFKPDFNDFLVHQGHLYGFDDAIFACIDLQTGKRKWKGGRYEKGQAFLLGESNLIIVVSERGELVLLKATPEKLTELAKLKMLSGKTWNHPVVIGNRLYVRNSEEAVCLELPTVTK